MLSLITLLLFLNTTFGFRGPHHPRGEAKRHHYIPKNDIRLTQDEELLHDIE